MLEQSWKKVYSRTTTKSIPLLQPEHGFSQQNGLERGQIQDWYPNERMVVVPVCLNSDVALQGAWVLYCINWGKGYESLPLLAFRREFDHAVFLEYSKESKLSMSHLGIWNISSDVYDDTKHY